MKVHFDKGIFVNEEDAKKAYFCDACGEEVYSLLCRRIYGKDYDICGECYEEEVKKKEEFINGIAKFLKEVRGNDDLSL